MRVVFMGTPAFAVPTLNAIVEAGHEVLGVVAQPDKPAGRGNALNVPPTVQRARELGLEVKQPKAVRSGAFPEWMESACADVAVVMAYGRILTPRLLAAPRLGCINVHASLLPRWRGAAPIQWSILAGDPSTGVATMQMAEGLDTGDVLYMEETPIGPEETAGELSERLSALGADLLLRTLAERPHPTPQDNALATHAPMLTKEHGRIDWHRPAVEIGWQVRGLSPWPGTFTTFRSEPLKILRVRPLPDVHGHAGAMLDGPIVACGEGALELLEVQLPGKKAVRGADFINGSRVKHGERLGT